MSSIKEIIDLFPNNLQDPMLRFWGIVKEELGVKREDFTELKNIVFELAQAQNRTEQRIEELAEAQKTLTEAQSRTEQRVEELAQAQSRTEQRVEELARAQKETERSLVQLTRTVTFTLGGLGRRWGMDSENSFRNGLIEILRDTGNEVSSYQINDTEGFVFGHPSVIDIDLIVRGDTIILVELKASVSKSDVYVFMKKAELYSRKTGKRTDRLVMITPFVDDDAGVFAGENKVVICDAITDTTEKLKIP